MTNGDKILQFSASQRGTFARRELLHWIESRFPSASLASIDVTLRRMTNRGMLSRIRNGEYKLESGSRTEFIIRLNDEMASLYQSIRTSYPYVNFCIWNANVVSSLMHNVPDLDIIILEADRIAAEAVFNDLVDMTQRRVLLKPSEKEYSLYASGNSCVIVKPLISESPLVDVDGISTPCIEKILVDISIDPEFPYARDSELYSIFEEAGERFLIDKKCMLRYASRRGRKREIEKMIESTIL